MRRLLPLALLALAAVTAACSSGDAAAEREAMIEAARQQAPPPAGARPEAGPGTGELGPAGGAAAGEESGAAGAPAGREDGDGTGGPEAGNGGPRRYLAAPGAPVLAERPAAGPAFRVDFGAPGRAVPPGLLTGVNDYNNASPGAWAAWKQALQPQGGVARLWLRRARAPLGAPHFRAAMQARKAGLSVYLCCKGAPENFVGNTSRTKQANARPPRDAGAWGRQLAGAIEDFRRRGVTVSHVEIWNEPDLDANWSGTAEEFAVFFARAGRVLQDALPAEVKLGGPGMARGWGGGLRLMDRMLDRCQETGFVPDFLSWHHYNGYPSDPEAFQQAERARALFARRGLPRPEIVLSEWNIALPGEKGAKAALDNHRAGVHFIAETTSLIHAGFDYSMWFFLQDLASEARQDYAGESVGIFTIHGGPKAVLNGMQMTRTAAGLPAVPVERVRAPWNITLLATRAGDRGYLLAANAGGSEEKRARKLLDVMGVDLSGFKKGSSERIKRYLAGRGGFQDLGVAAAQRGAWEMARQLVAEGEAESALRQRAVQLELADPPRSVTRVWALDPRHGNPAEDPDFMAAFRRLQEDAHGEAVEAALAELRRQGFDSAQEQKAAEALRKRDRALLKRSFGRRDQARVESEYQRAFARLTEEGPLRLLELPAAHPALIAAGERVALDGSRLRMELPPWTALLIEVSWTDGPGR